MEKVRANRALTEELGTLGSVLRVPFEAMLAHNWKRLHDAGYSDVRIAHGAVFRHISSEGSRIRELAVRAGMTKQSMAELVAYLHKHGYVDLSPDPDDRRGKIVRLTARGMEVFRILAEASSGFEAECTRLIGKARWNRLRQLLADLATALDKHAESERVPTLAGMP